MFLLHLNPESSDILDLCTIILISSCLELQKHPCQQKDDSFRPWRTSHLKTHRKFCPCIQGDIFHLLKVHLQARWDSFLCHMLISAQLKEIRSSFKAIGIDHSSKMCMRTKTQLQTIGNCQKTSCVPYCSWRPTLLKMMKNLPKTFNLFLIF